MKKRRRDFCCAAIFLGCLNGCASYRAVVHVQPNAHVGGAMSQAEIDRASMAAKRGVESVGMIVAATDRASRDPETSENDSTAVVVLESFTTGPEESAYIEVYSMFDRTNGRFFVMIRDFELPFSTRITQRIENAVARELRAEFPDEQIVIDRGSTWPSLGP